METTREVEGRLWRVWKGRGRYLLWGPGVDGTQFLALPFWGRELSQMSSTGILPPPHTHISTNRDHVGN